MNYNNFLSLVTFYTVPLIIDILIALLASNPHVEHALECTLALEVFTLICSSLCPALLLKTAQHLHLLATPEEESTQAAEDCNDISLSAIQQFALQLQAKGKEEEGLSELEAVTIDDHKPATSAKTLQVPGLLPHSYADCFADCNDTSSYGIEYIQFEDGDCDSDEPETVHLNECLHDTTTDTTLLLIHLLPHSFADCFKDIDDPSKYCIEFIKCEELPPDDDDDCYDYEDNDSRDDNLHLDATYDVPSQNILKINALPHSFADCFADYNDSSKYSIEIVQGENEIIEDTEEYDDDDDDDNYDEYEYDGNNEYSNYLNERNVKITDKIEQVPSQETLKTFIDEEQVGWLEAEAENQKMIQFGAAIKQVKPGILTEDYNIRRKLEVLCCNELLNFDSDSEDQGLCYDREEITGYGNPNVSSNRVLSETREYAQIGEGIGANTMHFCDKNQPIVQDFYYMNRASNFFYLYIYKAIDESIRRKIEERSLPQLKRWCDLYGTN